MQPIATYRTKRGRLRLRYVEGGREYDRGGKGYAHGPEAARTLRVFWLDRNGSWVGRKLASGTHVCRGGAWRRLPAGA